MNTKPTTAYACEFDMLRAMKRKCVRRSRRRPFVRRRARMLGIEVAYLAIADWLAAVAESERG